MSQRTLAAVLAAFLLPCAALSAEPAIDPLRAACTTYADLYVASQSVSAQIGSTYESDTARQWLDAYNAVPPVTDFHADMVVLVEWPGRATVVVVLLQDDCVTIVWNESRALIERINASIRGQSA